MDATPSQNARDPPWADLYLPCQAMAQEEEVISSDLQPNSEKERRSGHGLGN